MKIIWRACSVLKTWRNSMAKAGRLPDFRKMYPEASDEIISVLKETERKMQYQEYDLKAEQAVLDRKTGRVSILPGREDSLDRMMEAGLFPDRGEQDIEAEICSRLQYEKLHRAIRQLEKREQYLIIQLFFCGRSERELAGELCVSQNAINKQRGRILQKLRKILQNLSF